MSISTLVPPGVLVDQGQVHFDQDHCLVGGFCATCEVAAFPAPEMCLSCLEPMAPRVFSCIGTLYSYSTVHSGPAHRATPYTVGYVDVVEGARIFAHIEEPPERLRLDVPVRVRIEPADDLFRVTWTVSEASDA